MRSSLATGALVILLVAASGRAEQDAPRFRRQVDLITIDVSALDSAGRPVVNLRPGDFLVKVDGVVRPVVSADLIRLEPGTRPPSRADARISSNAMAPNARRVMIAVDQALIVPGGNRPVLDTASRFVERLAAADYAAYVAFPPPGPRVDFTTDKARVRKGMEQMIGNPQRDNFSEFVIGLAEALELTERGTGGRMLPPDAQTPTQLLQALHPILRDILEGGCGGATLEELLQNRDALERCISMVAVEAARITSEARVNADLSRKALEDLLEDLAPIEGPKTLVMISAGLVNDDPSLLDEATRLAAAARTTIHVVVVEPQRERGLQSNLRPRPVMSLVDRSIELQGLELLADRTGGDVYRNVAGTSEGVFQRIEAQLSAWYLLAVERRPGDPERQRVEVAATRRGVTVRSHKTFTSPNTIAARRSTDERLSNALSSPIPISAIPMRLATFTQRDGSPGQYRVRLAVELGRPDERAGEFAVGYALMNQEGELVTSAGSRRSLSPLAGGPNLPLRYETALSARPGTYSLRVGVLDSAGRVGTVVHPINLPPLDEATVTTSDLIVGHLPGEAGALSPSVEPRIDTGEVAGYLEIYVPEADRDRVSVRLELAEGEASPPLAAAPLTLRAGEGPSTLVATGFVGATMTPGRYVARATVRRDKEIVTTLIRPIEIVRDPTTPSPPRVRGVAMSLDLRRRTAAYVAGVVNGLANVVAQEDFAFTNPKKRVTSDLLLVRYPGSNRDLIPFRDVSLVDGAPVSDREARILDLFIKPTDGARDRARRITLSSDAYVPTLFNPMFVIGFLQADFQSGFDLTVSDAGREWPREVKAIAFVETRRPTLLRAGPFGDRDAPTRGTAWIEEGTGRILQTELQIGQVRSAPTMTTRFRLDDRLQVMVPEMMRTENPSAVVTYTNFRRFNVETETSIPAGNSK